ncbi:MAG TPA: ferredoxin [Candidatus Magasanikbacteria bacterium]|nr:ferredoxin [Candidatus Magasanikbacteria bacterium]
MKIKIDKNKCIGCGTCVALCPGSFKWDESGLKVEAINPPSDTAASLKDAAASCPVQAIDLE